MLKSPLLRRMVIALLLVAVAVAVQDGCAKPRKKKKKKKPYIPTAEEISKWRNRLRNTDFNMVTIPAGQYKLGDNNFKGNPARLVKLEAPFKIDRFEVTNEDWFLFLWATKGSEQYFAAPPVVMGDYNTDKWIQGSKYFEYDRANRAKNPIRAIGYHEAETFCKYVKKRLPTAVEWEIAARGPEGRKYPWGNTYTRADWKTRAQTSFMMGTSRSSEVYVHDTVPVDKLKGGQSFFGCFNMAGNVSEWTTSTEKTRMEVWKKRPRSERPEAQIVKGGNFASRQVGALSAQFFSPLASTATDMFRVGFRGARD